MEDVDEEHMKVIAVSSTQGSTAHECAAPSTSAHARPAVHSTAETEADAAIPVTYAAGRSIEGADGEWDPESVSKAGTGETGRSRSAEEGEGEGEAEGTDTLVMDHNEDGDAVEDEEMDANADSLVTGYRPAVLLYAEAGGRLAFVPCVDVLGPLWRGRARADAEAEVEEANRVFEYGDGIEVQRVESDDEDTEKDEYEDGSSSDGTSKADKNDHSQGNQQTRLGSDLRRAHQ